jgi:hypothetical protein
MSETYLKKASQTDCRFDVDQPPAESRGANLSLLL